MNLRQAKTVLIHFRDKLKIKGVVKKGGKLSSTPSSEEIDGLALGLAEDILGDLRSGKEGDRKVDAKYGFLCGLLISRGHCSLEDLVTYEKTSAPMLDLTPGSPPPTPPG